LWIAATLHRTARLPPPISSPVTMFWPVRHPHPSFTVLTTGVYSVKASDALADLSPFVTILGTRQFIVLQAAHTPTSGSVAGFSRSAAFLTYSPTFFTTSITGPRRFFSAVHALLAQASALLPICLTQFHALSRPTFFARSTALHPTHFAPAHHFPSYHLHPPKTSHPA